MNREELRARILATASPKPQPVNVPEWGDVYVKPLLVGEIETMSSDADPKLQTARGVARMLCDKNGDLLFDVNSPDDLFAINRLRASSLNKIHEAMEVVNATSNGAAVELKRLTPRDRFKLDLGEAMGWPLSAVNALTERELSLWMVRGPLWPRRLELLLIQLTDTLAKVNGNKTRMSDFDMFNKNREVELDNAANDIGMLVGAGVRKLGQGRK